MHDLTGFQRDVLYTIAGTEERHGLAIKNRLEEYYGSVIHHGRLYPNLDTLANKGMVEKGTIDRRTNSYDLTARGEREIESRREWEEQIMAGPSESQAQEQEQDQEQDQDEGERSDTPVSM